MKKIKFKTKSSSKKRFFLLSGGGNKKRKIKRSHSHISHLSHNKTKKRIMHLRKYVLVKNSEYKKIKIMLSNN